VLRGSRVDGAEDAIRCCCRLAMGRHVNVGCWGCVAGQGGGYGSEASILIGYMEVGLKSCCLSGIQRHSQQATLKRPVASMMLSPWQMTVVGKEGGLLPAVA
jgi:hypothetical protein